jgi:hypothetical protein
MINRVKAWTLLYESFPALRNTIHVGTINDPSNGMTLLTDLHAWFGDFRLAFEATVSHSKNLLFDF